MLLKRRIQLGGGLLALGVVALFAGHPAPVRGDRSGGHNLESHQYKDSRKCLLTAAAFGCNGDKRMVVAKRHVDKRQHGGGGGGGGRGVGGGGGDGGGEERGGGVDGGGSDRDNDLDHNGNFDYNYDDGGGKGDGDDDGGYGGEEGSPDTIDYYDPPLITDPRDRMLPVIYNPRPMYVPQEPLPPPPPPPFVPSHHPHQQPPLPPYTRYNDEVPPIRPLILGSYQNVDVKSNQDMLAECPPTEDGFERFACPSPDKEGRFRCIDDHVLCDGYIDCPNGDDEDRKNCFFFKTTKAHLDILADALLRWARGR